MTQEELNKIIENHQHWLRRDCVCWEDMRANLKGACLVQVERNNQQYHDEVARLNTEKNKARDNVLELIYDKIQYEVGHRISRKKAQAIWDYAYEKGHDFGFTSIQSELSDIIDLADTLLNTRTRNS